MQPRPWLAKQHRAAQPDADQQRDHRHGQGAHDQQQAGKDQIEGPLRHKIRLALADIRAMPG